MAVNPYLQFINPDGSIKKDLDDVPVVKSPEVIIPKPLVGRNERILNLYEEGLTPTQISKEVNLSREMIRVILEDKLTQKKQTKKIKKEQELLERSAIKVLRQFAIWGSHSASKYANGECKCQICKDLNTARCMEWRAKNREQYNTTMNKWQKANPDKCKKYSERHREKIKTSKPQVAVATETQ